MTAQSHLGSAADLDRSVGEVARFGQLTYTNYDGGLTNGWQVQESVGLQASEVNALRVGIDPQLDAGYELPRFPSPEDLERFPYRLVFSSTSTLHPGAMWWHHAPAGADGGGRPGNVYIHALLDRMPEQQDREFGGTVRPIDWWRSPDWLTPYGQSAVRESAVGAPPRPGPAISVGRIVKFVLDPDVDRLGVLSLLLDSCAAALDGGPPVVLGTRDTDTAALWIGTITHLTSAAVARRLAFSTLERSSSLDSRLKQGALLCCVPLADLQPLADREDRSYVLIGEDEPASLGDLDGSPHLTAAHDEITVTEWSGLARVTMFDEAHAAYALSLLDRLATSEARHPGWPLAVVVALDPETFEDGSAEAARLLVRWTPPTLVGEPLDAARDLVERQTRGDHATAEQAWRMLAPTGIEGSTSSPLATAVRRMYVTLALQDPVWLAQPGGPPVPSGAQDVELADDSLRRTIQSQLDRLAELEAGDGTAARVLVGVAELTLGLGLLDPTARERLLDQAGRLLAERLRDDPLAVVEQLGPASERLLREVVRPALAPIVQDWRRPLGQQLPRAALEWLYPDRPGPIVPLRGGELDDVPLAVELAWQRAVGDPRRYDGDRVLAITSALQADVEVDASGPLLSDPPLTVEQLVDIESDSSHRWLTQRLPWSVFGPVLVEADGAPPLQQLCRLLAERRSASWEPEYGVPALVRMRAIVARPWWPDAVGAPINLRSLLRGGVATQHVPGSRPAAAVVEALRAALLLASVIEDDFPEVKLLIDGGTAPGGLVGRGTSAMVVEGLRDIPLVKLALTAMLGDPRFPEQRLASSLHRWAHTVEVNTEGGEPAPMLRYAASLRTESASLGYASVLLGVNRRLWDLLAHSENRERSARACEKFAAGWLRSLYPAEGLLSRLRGAP